MRYIPKNHSFVKLFSIIIVLIDPAFSNKECFSKIQIKFQSTIRNPSSFLSNHSLCIKNICEKGKNAFDKSKIYLNRFSQIRKIELQYNCNWMIKKIIAI